MSEQTLVERLEARPGEDHTRGCQGREYTCSCGFNDATDALFTEAASELSRLSEALEDKAGVATMLRSMADEIWCRNSPIRPRLRAMASLMENASAKNATD
jgi:hypothetical protein